MTNAEIRERLSTLADQLQEMHTVISITHPKDDEGFVKPDNPDLADALKALDYAVTVLSRLVFRMN